MSLIELIETCSRMLSLGHSWEECQEILNNMGVDHALYWHIRNTMNEKGALICADGSRFTWGR